MSGENSRRLDMWALCAICALMSSIATYYVLSPTNNIQAGTAKRQTVTALDVVDEDGHVVASLRSDGVLITEAGEESTQHPPELVRWGELCRPEVRR